jgi:enamine deaminase RidA (YjgF/YER057c/UK114 family)
VPKDRTDKIDIIIVKNSLDFINDLEETNFSDINDPDLSEAEIEQIEKEANVRVRSSSFSITDAQIDILPRSNSITTKEVQTQTNQRFRLISRTESVDETDFEPPPSPFNYECEQEPIGNTPNVAANAKGWMWISGLQGVAENEKMAIESVMETLEKQLTENGYTLRDICYITLYVKDMRKYSKINDVYAQVLNFQNPPTRVCVECPLPENCHVILEAVAFKPNSYGQLHIHIEIRAPKNKIRLSLFS